MITTIYVKPKMAAVIAGIVISLTFCAGFAQDEQFIEGGHYELLDEVQPVQTGDKIEVVEMFWYRCPHCSRLEPFIIEWLKNIPQNAEYVPIPALLNPNWEFHARAYYTFQALGIVDEVHSKFFVALNDERANINSVEKLTQWVQDQNIEQAQQIPDTFFSFAVENKLNFANIMSRKYGITGVPAIIVDGRYRTTVALAGSHEKLIEVINFLIDKAARERHG